MLDIREIVAELRSAGTDTRSVEAKKLVNLGRVIADGGRGVRTTYGVADDVSE